MVFAFLAIKGDFAGIATVWVHTRKHVHQGRFTCTVLAADGVDLAAIDGKIHIGEGFDRTERLRDVSVVKMVSFDDMSPLLVTVLCSWTCGAYRLCAACHCVCLRIA